MQSVDNVKEVWNKFHNVSADTVSEHEHELEWDGINWTLAWKCWNAINYQIIINEDKKTRSSLVHNIQ